MRNHLSLRSGNPALKSNTFNAGIASSSNTMTLEGTINKTSLSLLVLMMTAFYTWNNVNPGLMIFGAIGGFIVAMITIFKKHLAVYTTLIYSGLEGLFLGGISKFYHTQYGDGIVGQAVFLTFSIFAALLFAYKSRLIKPTENFKLGVFAATAGIALFYLISIVMSFFGSGMPVMNPSNASMFSIGFSVFVVIIASLNLVLDFDFIEEGAENGAPKYMEWYGAFGLLVTLVWLYLEILRLLAKLQSRK
tara:strand:- start:17 stop:760 length:744 start_codon:yes stop_codon:yes gene_type:complete